MSTFDDVRRIALGLPEAEERITWDVDITFRVRDKIFAMGGPDGTHASIKAVARPPGRARRPRPGDVRAVGLRRPVRLGDGRPRPRRRRCCSRTCSARPGAGPRRRSSRRRWRRRRDDHDADELPDHVRRNRAEWDEWAPDYVENGERAGACQPGDETWGVWAIPEAELHLLPDDLDGKDTIELGCGTGYVSAWLARRGARPVGIDNSEQQLATARRLQAEHGLEFPLIHGNAESVPLPDASFDFAISEYGASIWADPYRWIPEASRLLRPGGQLVFLVNGLLLDARDARRSRAPATNELLRPAPRPAPPRMGRPTTRSTSHLSHGDWIRRAARQRLRRRGAARPVSAPDATTTSRPPPTSGPASGRAKRSGRPGSAADGRLTAARRLYGCRTSRAEDDDGGASAGPDDREPDDRGRHRWTRPHTPPGRPQSSPLRPPGEGAPVSWVCTARGYASASSASARSGRGREDLDDVGGRQHRRAAAADHVPVARRRRRAATPWRFVGRSGAVGSTSRREVQDLVLRVRRHRLEVLAAGGVDRPSMTPTAIPPRAVGIGGERLPRVRRRVVRLDGVEVAALPPADRDTASRRPRRPRGARARSAGRAGSSPTSPVAGSYAHIARAFGHCGRRRRRRRACRRPPPCRAATARRASGRARPMPSSPGRRPRGPRGSPR